MNARRAGVAAVIVAAGTGRRAGEGPPKAYRDVSGRPMVRRALEAFVSRAEIELVVAVISPDHDELFARAAEGIAPSVRVVHGGASRTQSVAKGLEALAETAPEFVLIHDAARPFVSPALIDRVEAALLTADGAVPALPLADALKEVDADGVVGEDLPRDRLRAVQTPQGFRFAPLLEAYRRIAEAADYRDDAVVAVEAGMRVVAVRGEPGNRKLTFPEDFTAAARRGASITVAGHGFDAHRFGPGDGLVLCGVRIPADVSLIGHSDADAGLHAVTDAILGAAAAGDIGQHFSPKDERWRGADSAAFLREALRLLKERGGAAAHADVTLICERPKIAPYRDAMRAALAELLGLSPDRVSVKATTTERMGFTGRGEGLAALATVTARLPAEPVP